MSNFINSITFNSAKEGRYMKKTPYISINTAVLRKYKGIFQINLLFYYVINRPSTPPFFFRITTHCQSLHCVECIPCQELMSNCDIYNIQTAAITNIMIIYGHQSLKKYCFHPFWHRYDASLIGSAALLLSHI